MLFITHGIVALVGLAVGSFVNVLALRLLARETIRGRSRCPSCRRTLRWFELIPVLSYCMQRGRCRSCNSSISVQYPLIEVATAILFVALWVSVAGNIMLFL